MSNLKELFEYKNPPKDNNIINDYDIFKDKDLLDNLRTKIVENIIDKNITNDDNLDDFLNNEINKTIEGYDLTNLERSHLYNLIENEINGYGPLTELLKDENITEIMVNSPSEIYIEIDGNLIKDESISFINDEHIIRTIQKLIEPLGRTIDSSSPMVDSRLKDGSRINAVIPPLSTKGPVITIRKFKTSISNIDELIRLGSLTPNMASFLEATVKSKMNILVCGGTGSGKTTLLNILSSFIPEEERIITIEDAAELKLSQPHVISLETRTTNYESTGEVTIRDLVRNSLRMRPDRIIVGEVRGGEAFDMLQAMNTGHEGSLTTLHANSNIDALHRLETMVLMANIDIPVRAVREYIFNAIDLVINIERLSDGKRKVSAISEVIDFKDDEIVLNDIFKFKQIGITSSKEVDGEFIETKKMPKCIKRLESYGFKDIEKIFK
ncbi:MAG: CpaF family protein [Bacilli bacterium]